MNEIELLMEWGQRQQTKKKSLLFFIGCGRQWNSWIYLFLSSLWLVGYGRLPRQGAPPREENEDKKQMNEWMELKNSLWMELNLLCWREEELIGEWNESINSLLPQPQQRNSMEWRGGPLPKAVSEVNSMKKKFNWLNFFGIEFMERGCLLLFLLLGYGPEAPLRETIPFHEFHNSFHFSFLGLSSLCPSEERATH